MFDNVIAVLPSILNGTIRPLAVTTTRRLAQLPGTPTLAEYGFPGFEAVA